MDNLYDLINIKKIDIEEGIKKAIKITKEELNNLTEERTCIIYSTYIKKNLNRLNIVSRIIDTTLLGLNYKHQFVMIPKDIDYYYVIDLTYNQFGIDDYFKDLYNNGYELMDNVKFNTYLKRLSNDYTFMNIDDAYQIKR